MSQKQRKPEDGDPKSKDKLSRNEKAKAAAERAAKAQAKLDRKIAEQERIEREEKALKERMARARRNCCGCC